MKDCKNCGKFPACTKGYKKECEEWVKQDYTTIVEKDNGIREIRRI